MVEGGAAIGGGGSGACLIGRFCLLVACVLGIALALLTVAGAPASAAGPPVSMSFHSRPDLRPPAVTVSSDLDPTAGDIFLTPRNSWQRHVDIQRGLEVVNAQGQLVWFHPLAGRGDNLEVQRYRDQPVLTWWQTDPSWSQTEDVIMNSSYQTVAVLHAGNGYVTDSHEFQITPQGTALIDATRPVSANLRFLHGSASATAIDDVIQELDIKTGRVLWSWHSLAHVPLADTYIRPWGSHPFDYFHLNSIQQLPNGNLLISARHTWAIYEISKQTGQIIWTVGGKHSSFHLGSGAKFEWQHDARLNGRTLSLFDDASDGPRQEESQSSGKILGLNMANMTATLEHTYRHSPGLVTVSQGNTQTLPDRNVFVGWGADPDFSEYSPSGRQIFSGSFALGVSSYRAYRFPWAGQPHTPPSVSVAKNADGTLTLYASWNGATQVARWRVLGGASPSSLTWVDAAPRRNFETAIRLKGALPYLAVQALAADGRVLATSAPVAN